MGRSSLLGAGVTSLAAGGPSFASPPHPVRGSPSPRPRVTVATGAARVPWFRACRRVARSDARVGFFPETPYHGSGRFHPGDAPAPGKGVFMSSRRPAVVVLALSLMGWFTGCGSEPRAFVAVDLVTDVRPSEFTEVVTVLSGGAGEERRAAIPAAIEEVRKGPWRVAEFGDLVPGDYQVRLVLRSASGEELLGRTVAFRVRGRRVVRVVVTRSCLAIRCPASGDAPERTECVGGRCVEPACIDGDEAGCGEPQCRDHTACRLDLQSCLGSCVAGVCLDLPAEGACGEGEACSPAGRCVAVQDAGEGEEGGVDAGMDSGPEEDGGGPADPCPDGCDDGNPCTEDRCTEVGCVFEPGPRDGERCDDGVYCNGEDRCMGGSCGVHAGNPCAGGTSCDEEGDRCVGCREDGDCPDPMMSPWSACSASGSSGDALCGGMQQRTVTSYRCDVSAGVCVGTDSVETRPCTTNEGLSCGSGSCGDWGACGGFSSACDTTGTQSRTCTSYTCSGGTCGSSTQTETRACTRNTNGVSCNDGNYCNGTERCSSGACVSSGNPCPSSTPICIESTDRCVECTSDAHCGGATPYCVSNVCVQCRTVSDCPGSSCGDWGACGGFSSACDTTGTQRRTCTSYRCVSNTCQASNRTETQDCFRITECMPCTRSGGQPGRCSPSGACIASCL